MSFQSRFLCMDTDPQILCKNHLLTLQNHNYKGYLLYWSQSWLRKCHFYRILKCFQLNIDLSDLYIAPRNLYHNSMVLVYIDLKLMFLPVSVINIPKNENPLLSNKGLIIFQGGLKWDFHNFFEALYNSVKKLALNFF